MEFCVIRSRGTLNPWKWPCIFLWLYCNSNGSFITVVALVAYDSHSAYSMAPCGYGGNMRVGLHMWWQQEISILQMTIQYMHLWSIMRCHIQAKGQWSTVYYSACCTMNITLFTLSSFTMWNSFRAWKFE